MTDFVSFVSIFFTKDCGYIAEASIIQLFSGFMAIPDSGQMSGSVLMGANGFDTGDEADTFDNTREIVGVSSIGTIALASRRKPRRQYLLRRKLCALQSPRRFSGGSVNSSRQN
jgi:hypothetical protein